MSAFMGELIGTALLVLLGNGVVANVVLKGTKGHNAGWIVITFGWAMAVFVGVWCVAAASGAHLNPAVTIGFVAAGKPLEGTIVEYLAGQMAGGVLGAIFVFWTYLDHYRLSDDPDAKLATFCTAPAIRRSGSNLFSEALGTFVLVLAALLAVEPSIQGVEAIEGAKLGLGSLGALPTGLLVLAIGLSLGGTTGYAINPARDLGPRIAHFILPVPGKRDSDWGYAWIPVAGPIIGAVLAAGAVWALTP